jgi:hypothetical protein
MRRKRAPARNLALALQGTLAAAPPVRGVMSALLGMLKIFFGFFRYQGG